MDNGKLKTVNGFLLVDKPTGWTSHDVVAKFRSILNKSLATSYLLSATPSPKVKVGHTGTLDPMATGLLILVIGNYTKRASEFSKLDKVYEAELILGAVSSTGDKEGKITQKSDKKPTLQQIDKALSHFTGKIQQRPHAYSAVKVGGKKAYEIARQGAEIRLELRPVTIYEITDVKYEYPMLKFTSKVSSGTYIRSLAEDIGEALGTGAYLSTLRRTKVGNFSIDDAVLLDKIGSKKLAPMWLPKG